MKRDNDYQDDGHRELIYWQKQKPHQVWRPRGLLIKKQVVKPCFLQHQMYGNFWLRSSNSMHNIKSNFIKVKSILTKFLENSFASSGNFLRPGPKPKFTDLDVMTLSITAECMCLDSENYLFHLLRSTYKDDFPYLISRRQYNDRRKGLFFQINEIRQAMANELNELKEVFALDSMPLEICKYSRADRNKMGNGNSYYAPDKGYCASQSKWFFGYKLHGVCSPYGVIQMFDLSQASVHDINFLKDVSNNMKNCLIAGDRGYIGKNIKEKLWLDNKICLETPLRSNQKEGKPMLYVLRKVRKRMETVFSQLCDQFLIQRNYAKSFYGFRTRILAKITGMTVLQYMNKFITKRPIGQIKYSFL